MPGYRLFFMGPGGSVEAAQVIRANSVEDAVHRAREMQVGEYTCEVWDRHGIVARFHSAEPER